VISCQGNCCIATDLHGRDSFSSQDSNNDACSAVIVTLAEQRVHTAQEETKDDPCGHEHYSQRGPWLRAAVLGANDGLVTVGALMTGISAANASQQQLILTAVAALVSGANAQVQEK
jgi:VIT1/CCC1 family predicted Fe2+/Mn2+ transporter